MSEIKGLDHALKLLNEMPTKVLARINRKGMKEAGEIVLEAAKSNVMANGLYNSGTLYKSIAMQRVRTRTRAGSMTVKISAEFYGRFHEFGYLHIGGKHIPARPWLVPALNDNENKVIDKIGNNIKEEVDKITGNRSFSGVTR